MLRECFEDSLKLAQEELQKSQKRHKKHYIMTRKKPRRLEESDQVLLTDSNKLLMQLRGAYIVEIVWEPTTTE